MLRITQSSHSVSIEIESGAIPSNTLAQMKRNGKCMHLVMHIFVVFNRVQGYLSRWQIKFNQSFWS